jgi:hypothetical protein
MFLFQLFQFLSLVERLLDRKTGRIDGAWAFRESLADSERRRRRSDQVVGGGSKRPGLANTFRVRNTFGWGTRSLRDLGGRGGSTGRRVRIFGESERRRRSEPSGVAKLFRVGNALGWGDLDARGCFRRCGDRPPARERGRASLRLSRGCAVLRSKSVSGMNFFGSVLDAVRRGGRAVR